MSRVKIVSVLQGECILFLPSTEELQVYLSQVEWFTVHGSVYIFS